MNFLIWLTVLSVGVSLSFGSFNLRLLHMNDMHARIEQVSQSAGKCSVEDEKVNLCYGGFARVYTALQNELKRAKNENVTSLCLNAGDTFQGTIWYSYFKWRAVGYFMDKLPFEAMALGNHEFDDGVGGLVPFLQSVKIPALAANIDFSKEPLLSGLKDVLIIEKNGRKIGIIGYLTPETIVLADTGALTFEDEIKILKEKARRLKEKNVNIIVALGHSGYEKDLEIAAEVPDVDIVVGGHSHTFLYTGTPPDIDKPADKYPVLVRQKTGRTVAMVQAYAFTKYLGILDVTFDDNGEITKAVGNPILLDHKIPEDPTILNEIKDWKNKMNATLKEPIGMTKVILDASQCRFFECNFGNLITDAYIHYGVMNNTGPFWGAAGIAIQQAGGIRTSINVTNSKSIITKEDVITSMPFFTRMSVVEIKGEHLLEALEWSVARYDPNMQYGRGEFLQMSGIRVTYDLFKEPGSRVASVEVRCLNCEIPRYVPLRVQNQYRVIMPTFLFKGGDNFTMFKLHGNEIAKFDVTDTEATMQYIQQTNWVYHGLENRIQFASSGGFSLKPNFNYLLFILLFKFF